MIYVENEGLLFYFEYQKIVSSALLRYLLFFYISYILYLLCSGVESERFTLNNLLDLIDND